MVRTVPAIESLFEFLFKYRPVVFQRGDLAFGSPWPIALTLLLGAVVGDITASSWAVVVLAASFPVYLLVRPKAPNA